MSDDRDPSGPLTPEEEGEVSRLLADAGGEVPMPSEVAERLTRVLADLSEERGSSADVVALRPRRRWPTALLAAAALVVGGFAVGNMVGDGSVMSDSGGDAARPEAAADAGGGASLDDGADAPGEAELGGGSLGIQTPRLRSDQLEAGVLRVLEQLQVGALRDQRLTNDRGALPSGCRPGGLGARESWVRATYDGRRAVLVLGPERSGSVEARVLACGGALLDGTTVPAP